MVQGVESPVSLDTFKDAHRGETIVVCGCGASLNDLARPDEAITIGVNDVGRRFDPTYLVVVNPRSQFSRDRFRHIEQSRARALFTQLDLGIAHPRIVRFRLGRYGGTSFDDSRVLHYTRNSPYVALCLAAHMGARRIGLIGVDFTGPHFFGTSARHALSGHVAAIDAEYRALAGALERMGVEVVNLSRVSRLTAFPSCTPDVFLAARASSNVSAPVAVLAPAGAAMPAIGQEAAVDEAVPAPPRRVRVFGVSYRFLACGHVFTDGLRRAARELDIDWADAAWDDPRLPAAVDSFRPDLLFVIHGRKFAQRWGTTFTPYRSAVWLLDEPYEVDDTARFSARFDHVFVNDPATLTRHPRAHHLPVCFDPAAHHDGDDDARAHAVGFVGGGNPTRERWLARLSARGLLSYVVGGPWREPGVARLALARNLPPAEVAALYRATRIVINVFRDRHHFNRQGIAASSMNPRVYEALACGALVISEPRPECRAIIPELPVFESEEELASLVRRFLADEPLRRATRDACFARVRQATYAARLQAVLAATVSTAGEAPRPIDPPRPRMQATRDLPGVARERMPAGWDICGPVDLHAAADADSSDSRRQVDALTLSATTVPAPGSERGIAAIEPHTDIELSFDVFIPSGASFIVKLRQGHRTDQTSNSYHLCCENGRAYLARHHCVFHTCTLPTDVWIRVRFACRDGVIELDVDGHARHIVRDRLLTAGYAFLGVRRGRVRLRDIRLTTPISSCTLAAATGDIASTNTSATAGAAAVLMTAPVPVDADTLHDAGASLQPRVSIVTTVYDRVECLTQCLRSVQRLRYSNYEHIVVSDAPPRAVVERVTALVRSIDDPRGQLSEPAAAPQQLGHCARRRRPAASARRICLLSLG